MAVPQQLEQMQQCASCVTKLLVVWQRVQKHIGGSGSRGCTDKKLEERSERSTVSCTKRSCTQLVVPKFCSGYAGIDYATSLFRPRLVVNKAKFMPQVKLKVEDMRV